jgi:hypothetical protein
MTITLEITPDLENELRQAAADAGVAPDVYILELLRQGLEQVARPRVGYKQLPRKEAALLQQINRSLSQIEWQRYYELVAKRKAETLTPAEQDELIALSDAIEAANVKRMEALTQLARLRKTTMRTLIAELGLKPVTYA